ncbi:MAG: copper amine oxidase N-terminal domain-containing protein [Tissierellia bacterium]|nr:copper amine oxidase N-terminal domain-containing protein [Tissierellia bacterium]
MKKVSFIVIILILAIFSATMAHASTPLSLYINGKAAKCNPEPQLVNNTTMVPLRFIAEELGADVTYDPISRRIDISTSSPQNVINLNGIKTTWPYWEEEGDLYLEYRNAIELLRNKFKSPWYSVSFYPNSQTLFINNSKYTVITKEIDGYTLLSCNSLMKNKVIKLNWDPSNADLTVLE